jgi:hypothetical protein
MTNERRKKIWLKVAELAENPETNGSMLSPRWYLGLCDIFHYNKKLFSQDDIQFCKYELYDVMEGHPRGLHFWETDVEKTDNGDRILAAYFMAYYDDA